MTIAQQLRAILVERFELTAGEITPERSLQSLGIDSLATLELLFEFKDQLGIDLPIDRSGVVTFQDLVDVVERETAGQCEHA